ncbi:MULTISPECIES: hypothetical protein [Paenibacillus]|uniref:hypothetical protein n=1 Tax=Paenibacillus TaxID=44249 RepID=UPI0022B8FC69|nr:hypothetical protein [Paenibacillus caseinilyticus]MCZ8523572.1 hypothetical protein [Paenibacillus caseinilyticus]
MREDTQIVETAIGTWLRFPGSFKKHQCLVELSDQLSLDINLKSGLVHVHQKDGNNVFQHVGDLALSPAGGQLQLSFVSTQPQERQPEMAVAQPDAS